MHLERFKQDVQRWIKPEAVSPPELVTVATTLKLLFRHIPVRAMLWYRFGGWCHEKRFPFFSGFIQRQLLKCYGLEIGVGADVEGGLYIAHPVGTVINAEHIGRNCTIISAVTIGMRNEWVFPTIGADVFIGSGARILGDVVIGDGAKIGANAVVIDDVPGGATAVGIPARVLPGTGRDKTERAAGEQDAELASQ